MSNAINSDADVLVPNIIAITSAEDCDRSDAFDPSRQPSDLISWNGRSPSLAARASRAMAL